MNAKQLSTIAGTMRRQIVGEYGAAEEVVNGTHIALMRRDRRCHLYIGNRDALPDPASAAQIASAFGVAEGTEPRRCKVRLAAQDGHAVPVHCLAYSWTEIA